MPDKTDRQGASLYFELDSASYTGIKLAYTAIVSITLVNNLLRIKLASYNKCIYQSLIGKK